MPTSLAGEGPPAGQSSLTVPFILMAVGVFGMALQCPKRFLTSRPVAGSCVISKVDDLAVALTAGFGGPAGFSLPSGGARSFWSTEDRSAGQSERPHSSRKPVPGAVSVGARVASN